MIFAGATAGIALGLAGVFLVGIVYYGMKLLGIP
jgi:hypothetical protein